jgi:hypothetical protein
VSKGRRVPPIADIHIISEGPKLTVAEAIARVQAHPGFYALETQHDEWCPAWRTQSEDDCICEPTHRLWTLKARGAA